MLKNLFATDRGTVGEEETRIVEIAHDNASLSRERHAFQSNCKILPFTVGKAHILLGFACDLATRARWRQKNET